MKYPTLEELALESGPVDIKEFGLKTEGLVELIRAKDIFRNQGDGKGYDVPAGFVVSNSARMDSRELKRSFQELGEKDGDFFGILVRGTAHDELPGQTPTLPVLYDPSAPDSSFHKFINALYGVRTESLNPVVVQRMVGEVTYLERRTKVLARFPLYARDLDYGELAEQIRDGTDYDYHEFYDFHVHAGRNNFSTLLDLGRWAGSKGEDAEIMKKAIEQEKNWLENPQYDKVKKLNKNRAYIEVTSDCIPARPVIGYTNTGFIVRSHSHIDPNEAAINICLGLSNKLVANPDEIAIMTFDKQMGWSWPVSTGNTYKGRSQEYIQRNMDVFDVGQGKIIEVPADSHKQIWFWNDIPMPTRIHNHLYDIADIMEHFAGEYGVPVEIEGSCTGNAFESNLHLYQLTKSQRLENVLERLTAVPKERQVLDKARGVIGSIKFSGDVVYAATSASEPDISELIRRCQSEGKRFLLISPGFRDDVIEPFGLKDYVNLSSENEVLTHLGYRKGGGFTGVHVFGYLTAQLHKRRLRGDNACAVVEDMGFDRLAGKDFGEYSNRREVYIDKRLIVFKDVTVEATKGGFQIYFN